MKTEIQLLELYYEKSDRGALDTLFARHYPAVYRTILNLVHNSFDANDLTQATFLKVIETGRSYKPSGSFRNWILTIAINEVRQFHRKLTARPKEDWLFDMVALSEADGNRVERDVMRREFEQKLEYQEKRGRHLDKAKRLLQLAFRCYSLGYDDWTNSSTFKEYCFPLYLAMHVHVATDQMFIFRRRVCYFSVHSELPIGITGKTTVNSENPISVVISYEPFFSEEMHLPGEPWGIP